MSDELDIKPIRRMKKSNMSKYQIKKQFTKYVKFIGTIKSAKSAQIEGSYE